MALDLNMSFRRPDPLKMLKSICGNVLFLCLLLCTLFGDLAAAEAKTHRDEQTIVNLSDDVHGVRNDGAVSRTASKAVSKPASSLQFSITPEGRSDVDANGRGSSGDKNEEGAKVVSFLEEGAKVGEAGGVERGVTVEQLNEQDNVNADDKFEDAGDSNSGTGFDSNSKTGFVNNSVSLSEKNAGTAGGVASHSRRRRHEMTHGEIARQ
jgi:hypothetical protein